MAQRITHHVRCRARCAFCFNSRGAAFTVCSACRGISRLTGLEFRAGKQTHSECGVRWSGHFGLRLRSLQHSTDRTPQPGSTKGEVRAQGGGLFLADGRAGIALSRTIAGYACLYGRGAHRLRGLPERGLRRNIPWTVGSSRRSEGCLAAGIYKPMYRNHWRIGKGCGRTVIC